MKTLFLLCAAAAASLALAGSALAQTKAAAAQTEAVRQFPDLAKPGSDFNKAFLAAVEQVRKTDPGFLNTDNWPIDLAFTVGAQLGVAPTARTGVVSIKDAETDLQLHLGKPMLLEGQIGVSDYYDWSYAGAAKTHLSFDLRDGSGVGHLYAVRGGAAEALRQAITGNHGHPLKGVFQVVIAADRNHSEKEGLMVDLVKTVVTYTPRGEGGKAE